MRYNRSRWRSDPNWFLESSSVTKRSKSPLVGNQMTDDYQYDMRVSFGEGLIPMLLCLHPVSHIARWPPSAKKEEKTGEGARETRELREAVKDSVRHVKKIISWWWEGSLGLKSRTSEWAKERSSLKKRLQEIDEILQRTGNQKWWVFRKNRIVWIFLSKDLSVERWRNAPLFLTSIKTAKDTFGVDRNYFNGANLLFVSFVFILSNITHQNRSWRFVAPYVFSNDIV